MANLLHNADGISVAFQPCKMTKGIQLFPVARTKSILSVLCYIYNSTIMVLVTVDLKRPVRLVLKMSGVYTSSLNLAGFGSSPVPLFRCSLRLQERRRSSVVVSLSGLDISPGDLFVSNGAADMLNGSNFSGKILLYYIILYIKFYWYCG